MRIKKTYRIIYAIALIFVGYLTYKSIKLISYKNIFESQSSQFIDDAEAFCYMRKENFPSNEIDFNQLITFLEEHSHISELLSYGIGFNFNPENNILVIYSFGPDRSDNNLENVIPSEFEDESFMSDRLISWDDLFQNLFFENKDVKLIELVISESDFLCNNISEYEDLIRKQFEANSFLTFLKNNQPVSYELESKILDSLSRINWQIDRRNMLNEQEEVTFVRYKNEQFYPVCTTKLDTTRFNSSFASFLAKNEIDYAVLPAYFE